MSSSTASSLWGSKALSTRWTAASVRDQRQTLTSLSSSDLQRVILSFMHLKKGVYAEMQSDIDGILQYCIDGGGSNCTGWIKSVASIMKQGGNCGVGFSRTMDQTSIKQEADGDTLMETCIDPQQLEHDLLEFVEMSDVQSSLDSSALRRFLPHESAFTEASVLPAFLRLPVLGESKNVTIPTSSSSSSSTTSAALSTSCLTSLNPHFAVRAPISFDIVIPKEEENTPMKAAAMAPKPLPTSSLFASSPAASGPRPLPLSKPLSTIAANLKAKQAAEALNANNKRGPIKVIALSEAAMTIEQSKKRKTSHITLDQLNASAAAPPAPTLSGEELKRQKEEKKQQEKLAKEADLKAAKQKEKEAKELERQKEKEAKELERQRDKEAKELEKLREKEAKELEKQRAIEAKEAERLAKEAERLAKEAEKKAVADAKEKAIREAREEKERLKEEKEKARLEAERLKAEEKEKQRVEKEEKAAMKEKLRLEKEKMKEESAKEKEERKEKKEQERLLKAEKKAAAMGSTPNPGATPGAEGAILAAVVPTAASMAATAAMTNPADPSTLAMFAQLAAQSAAMPSAAPPSNFYFPTTPMAAYPSLAPFQVNARLQPAPMTAAALSEFPPPPMMSAAAAAAATPVGVAGLPPLPPLGTANPFTAHAMMVTAPGNVFPPPPAAIALAPISTAATLATPSIVTPSVLSTPLAVTPAPATAIVTPVAAPPAVITVTAAAAPPPTPADTSSILAKCNQVTPEQRELITQFLNHQPFPPPAGTENGKFQIVLHDEDGIVDPKGGVVRETTVFEMTFADWSWRKFKKRKRKVAASTAAAASTAETTTATAEPVPAATKPE